MSEHGYEDTVFRKEVEDYYDVESAIKFFNSPVPEGRHRWRCVLCGWGLDVSDEQQKVIGAVCCGGCGMTSLRPIAEWRGAV